MKTSPYLPKENSKKNRERNPHKVARNFNPVRPGAYMCFHARRVQNGRTSTFHPASSHTLMYCPKRKRWDGASSKG